MHTPKTTHLEEQNRQTNTWLLIFLAWLFSLNFVKKLILTWFLLRPLKIGGNFVFCCVLKIWSDLSNIKKQFSVILDFLFSSKTGIKNIHRRDISFKRPVGVIQTIEVFEKLNVERAEKKFEFSSYFEIIRWAASLHRLFVLNLSLGDLVFFDLAFFDRIWRLADTKFENKQPILLDARHTLVRLSARNFRRELFHQGLDNMRSVIRFKYAILMFCRLLNSTENRCVIWRKPKAIRIQPYAADLPDKRLGNKKSRFSTTVVDYFGPFYITIRKSTEKSWDLLVTCLTTMILYLEVVPSLDTS